VTEGIGPNATVVRRTFEPMEHAVQRAKHALTTAPRRAEFIETRAGTFLALHFENGMQLQVPARAVLWVSDPVN
jgi:hypothetical protein